MARVVGGGCAGEGGGRRPAQLAVAAAELEGRGAEESSAGPLLLRYAAVGEGEGMGRDGPAPSGVGPCSSATTRPAVGGPCSSATTCALPVPLRRWPPVLGRGRCRPARASSAMARDTRSSSPRQRTEERERRSSSPPPSSRAPPAAPALPPPRHAAPCGSSASAQASPARSSVPAAHRAACPLPPRRPPTPPRTDPAGESEHEGEMRASQRSTWGGQQPRWIGHRQSTLVRCVLDLK